LVANHQFKLQMVLGNHDTLSETAKYYNRDVQYPRGKMDYSYREGAFKYIFLDSSVNALNDHQLEWLEREINREARILLFLHHPILEIDTAFDKMVALKDRHTIRKLLVDSGCEVNIFCGHYHVSDTATDGKLSQFSSPAISYQVEKDPNRLAINSNKYGYRRIMIDGIEMRTDIVMFDKE